MRPVFRGFGDVEPFQRAIERMQRAQRIFGAVHRHQHFTHDEGGIVPRVGAFDVAHAEIHIVDRAGDRLHDQLKARIHRRKFGLEPRHARHQPMRGEGG
ncbi:MAG: hypothetical protein QM789_20170 [Paenirhodobacter sp.]